MKKLSFLFLFLSFCVFYFLNREDGHGEKISTIDNISIEKFSSPTKKSENTTSIKELMLSGIKSNFDYIGKLEEAIFYVVAGDDTSYKQVDDVLRKMKDDKKLSDDEKTIILWTVMNEKPIIFDYFSTFIIKLSPHIIAEDVINFIANDQNTLLNRVNSLIILVSSFDTCSKNEYENLKAMVSNFVSPLIYNTDEQEGLYSNYIHLYKLSVENTVFNEQMKLLLSGKVSKENSLSIYNELQDTMKTIDFINLVNESHNQDGDKNILVISALKTKSQNLSKQERKDIVSYLDKKAVFLPEKDGVAYSVGDITRWIEEYGYVASSEDLSIRVFSIYGRDPFLSSSLLLAGDNYNIMQVDNKTDAIKNIYNAYQLNKDVNQDNADILLNTLNHILDKEPSLKEKYPL